MSLFQKSIIRSEVQKISDSEIKEHWDAYRNYFHNKKVQLDLITIKEQGNQTTFLTKTFCDIFGYTLNEAGVDGNIFREVGKSEFADGAIKKDGEVIAVIELKSSKTKNLKDIEDQVFKYQSRYNCNYAITSNFYKLRFYINSSSEYEEFDLFNLDISRFKVLWICLSKANLFDDLPRKLKDKSLVEEKIVTNSLYKDYSAFRKDLFKDLKTNNPFIPEIELLNSTQKLLDRLLFIFFGEDKGLLPENLISEIIGRWQNRVDYGDLGDDEYLYHHFQNYFQLINKGRKAKNNIGEIFPYNGGLFKEDGLLNSLIISDETLKNHTLKLTSYDFESDISVNILGHIFEHSLSEIEELQNQIEGKELDKSRSKRKKDGVFYTPQYITKYIVDNTVGKLCEEKKIEFNIIEDEYFKGRKGRQKNKLESLRDTLEEYRKWLLGLTICDPACGSGAFLNQALDFLISEHNYIDELQNSLMGGGFKFPEIENSILENNLYGVDINKESVEITKLSLWLRTAQPNRKLNSLSSNIKCGNSLIDEPIEGVENYFKWEQEFPKVFEKGGFDVVIGNPPYVNIERLEGNIKKYLYNHYESASGRTDLYILFVEKSLTILNLNGLMGLIIPYSFTNQNYGETIRRNIIKEHHLYSIVDTSKYFVFSDATVKTILIFLGKTKNEENTIIYRSLNSSNLKEFNHSLKQKEFLKLNKCVFETKPFLKFLNLKDKIEEKSTKLEEICLVAYGVRVNSKLDKNKPKNHYVYNEYQPTFKKFIEGKDVERYYYKQSKWLNYKPDEHYNSMFSELFENEKLCFINVVSDRVRFTYDNDNTYNSHTVVNCVRIDKLKNVEHTTAKKIVKGVDIEEISKYDLKFLLSILNSNLLNWYFLTFLSEGLHFYPNDAKQLPIKFVDNQFPFIEIVDVLISLNKKLQELSEKFQRTLQRNFEIDTLSKKLQEWYLLSYNEFLKELSKKKVKLSLEDEGRWEDFFISESKKALGIKDSIDKTDKEIDQMVYELYGLTQEEIEIVENAIR